MLLAWTPAHLALAAGPTELASLEVNGEGIAVASGILTLPAPPDFVRRLLTDAWNWPNLFVSPVRVTSVTQYEDQTVTDMYLSPPLFFRDLHMLVETREISRYRVETRLVRGDVRQYAHVWQLTPLPQERCTRAALEVRMQLKTWVPTWLLRWLTRREFEGHLERVLAETARRAGDGTTCTSGEPADSPSG